MFEAPFPYLSPKRGKEEITQSNWFCCLSNDSDSLPLQGKGRVRGFYLNGLPKCWKMQSTCTGEKERERGVYPNFRSSDRSDASSLMSRISLWRADTPSMQGKYA